MSQATGRVPLRGDDDPQVSEIFARVTKSAGAVPNLYRALAHAPVLLEGWIDYAWALRGKAESDRGLRELAILRVAQLTGSDYVWRSHFKAAQSGGVEDVKLDQLAAWTKDVSFTPAERALLQMTDELTTASAVADPTWAEFHSFFNDREAVELVLTVAWYACVARVNAGLDVPLDDAATRVAPVPPPDPAVGEHAL